MTTNTDTLNTIKQRLYGLLRSRKAMTLMAVAGTLLMMAGAIPFYLHAVSHESTDDAFLEAHVISISPRVAGHVAKVLVDDNQQVEKGELLAELDSRDYVVALQMAEARLQSARAEVTEAQAQASAATNILVQKEAELFSKHAGLAQVKAEMAEIRAGHDRDQQDLGRMKRIVQAGAVSRQEYDHAKTQEAMARAKLDSAKRLIDTHSAKIMQARAAIDTARDQLQEARAKVDAKTAELNEAEAAVERARLNLSYTRVIAPCNGHVAKKAVEEGAYVQVGQKLFSIVEPGIWVVANFKETQISRMQPGQPVEIEVDSYPDRIFRGHVDSIQRGTGSRFSLLPPENASGNFIKVVQRVPVKIVLDDPDIAKKYVMAPGMSVIPSVDISVTPEASESMKKTAAVEE